jgi:hypothetical protein
MHALAMSKNIALRLTAALCAVLSSAFAAEAGKPTAAPDGSRIVIETPAPPAPVPVLFSAAADQAVALGRAELAGETRVKLHIVQGRPETLSLGLSGDGEVLDVVGPGLRDWSVRKGASNRRFLDLRLTPPATPATAVPGDFNFTVLTRLRQPAVPGNAQVLLLTPGDAVGFSSRLTLRPDPTVDFAIAAAQGLNPVGDTNHREATQFLATGDSLLEIKLTQRGASAAEAELSGAQLTGVVNDAARSVDFQLRGTVRAQKAGARLRLLSGLAAPSGETSGDGWHLELVPTTGDDYAYDLVCERAGSLTVVLVFSAAVSESDDWREIEFAMPAGAVVPLRLEGLPAGVSFAPDSTVVPTTSTQGWQGFLPAEGKVTLSWKNSREAGEGALFFTSAELSEVRIGAGLLRQSSKVSFRILQGKLGGVRCRLEGPGEIGRVEGPNVVGWKVVTSDTGRMLDIRFNRPVETEGTLTIDSQAELGRWPVRAEPLRLTPEGGVRHSGFVRIANAGAVRLEIAEASGLMQLAPAQFPGGAAEAGARQIFVYRFPSAARDYRVLASQIQPEVGVAAIVTYELTDTARVISGTVELDVREAPLRDWTLRIPEDYSVVSLTGAEVADYVAESVVTKGTRALRVLFGRAVEGRQLLQLRLEKNQPAAAGEWRLAPLQFPEGKTLRAHVGAVATPGFRLVPAATERLVDTPLSFFPRQTPGLQQAWRVREPDWSAALRVEALGQSVQADVFHLYSLRPGVVATSVLINYFVVGAPATEWRIEVPAAMGNLDVIGQNVRRDWRREGDQLIISLHQPVLGAATLLVTFEQPMSARGGTIAPGVVRPLGVQAERGFVQVVSPLQVRHDIRKSEGLLKLEPTELPAEFRALTTAPSLAVYQYTARPFALEVGVEWYAPSETVEQVVDFAKFSSQVSRDGQVVTEAKFFVKTRGQKALRLTLPEGAKLWEARVDNALVNARADAGQTLIPLPAKANPNDPVAVALRLGQAAVGSGTSLQLIAPRIGGAPIVVSDWLVRGDTGRQLVPAGGTAAAVSRPLTEDGFEWIGTRGGAGALALFFLAALSLRLLRDPDERSLLGLTVTAAAIGLSAALALGAFVFHRHNASELAFATTLLPAGEALSLRIDNLPEWRALLVSWGLGCAVVGAVLLALGRRLAARTHVGSSLLSLGGALALALGLLAQHGGAVVFFALTGLVLFVRVFVPAFAPWQRERRERGATPLSTPGTAVTSLVLVGLALAGALMQPTPAQAQNTVRPAAPAPARSVDSVFELAKSGATVAATPTLPDGTRPAQGMIQRWNLRGERLFAELDFTARGRTGDTFLLLRAPAVLTEFTGNGLRLSKVEREGHIAYYVASERDGAVSARVRFELAVPDRLKSLPLPTGPAAAQRVFVELDEAGWEVTSPAAVSTQPLTDLGNTRSGAVLVLTPDTTPVIKLRPMRRDLSTETTAFFAETANLFLPGPGVVNGLSRVTVRPAQGRVSSLEIEVPAGLTVGDVNRGPVGAWRFDPQKRRLQIAIEPAQSDVFSFLIETQLGAGELPFALTLEPLRLVGAAGDVGLLALAFGGDAQPEGLRPTGLSVVNPQDLDPALLPRSREGQPLATVQQAWRYGPEPAKVELRVAPVAPEVRVGSKQVLSLDDDRMVLSVDLQASITRVGLFKLSFILPEGLEVEALTGPSLNHWADSQEGAQRIVTLHLKGRTLGEQTFNLTLAGAAPHAQAAWAFPRLLVREATRQTADVLVVPGKGLRLRAVDRERVTPLDPRSIGGQQPGSLAFRLLQADWVLTLGIEALDPWVTVQALQEVTLREGQTLTRLALRYRVENAAVKQVRVRLPGLSEEGIRTVRATGTAVSDIVRVADTPDTWEIRFQRGIAGETDVQIEFQGAAPREQGRESLTTPEFTGTRQVAQFVAIRSGGRLELEAAALPRGWTRHDWSGVPAILQNRADRSVPALCFRVAEPEAPLAINVRRHAVAEALKLRVTQGQLTTLFAPSGDFLTAVDLKIDVLEKSTLRVRLPAQAKLFNTVVNGENVSVVREADAYLFHVAPNTTSDRIASVRLVYSATGAVGRRVALAGPSLSVPLENVTWRVIVPPGFDLDDYRGGLRMVEEHTARSFELNDYVSLVSSRRSAEANAANASLKMAGTLLAQGEQEKAGETLLRLSNSNVIDAASNEDARVQLRNLRTQQTLLGLNTRRQRLYLDNRGDTARNELLEQAAGLNPLMQGKGNNFNPQQLDQFLAGNSADENTALRGIATRIVDQQLGAEPVPGALDVTMAEHGRAFTFSRALQVDGSAPLELDLKISPTSGDNGTVILCLVLGVGVVMILAARRRSALAA